MWMSLWILKIILKRKKEKKIQKQRANIQAREQSIRTHISIVCLLGGFFTTFFSNKEKKKSIQSGESPFLCHFSTWHRVFHVSPLATAFTSLRHSLSLSLLSTISTLLGQIFSSAPKSSPSEHILLEFSWLLIVPSSSRREIILLLFDFLFSF